MASSKDDSNRSGRTRSITRRDVLRYCGFCLLASVVPCSGVHPFRLFSPSQEPVSKNYKKAQFYSLQNNLIHCQKCPNECVLDNHESGICRNRMNIDGILYSTGYGNPCAVHVDPVEKKPLYHFLPTSLTFSIAVAGCSFRCLNCQNWQISQYSPAETQNYDLMPEAVVRECINAHCASIAYTYSEPTTFYEYVSDTSKLARNNGVRNILKSNGYLNEQPFRQLCRHLDAANIDLKSFDDSIYRTLSGGKLAPILKGLQILKEEKIWLEITNLVIPHWTDNFAMIKRMCTWLATNGFSETPLHFSRFTPLHKLTQLPPTPVSTLEKACEIAHDTGIKYVYIGNVPGHKGENTYCHRCGKLLLERRGFSILENNLIENRCSFCRTSIPGVWS